MEAVISLISTVNLVRDRYRSVGRDVESQDQLLQVWPMVLVFPVSEQFLDIPARVLPRKSHCCGVVVNARTVELKDLDDSQGPVERTRPYVERYRT